MSRPATTRLKVNPPLGSRPTLEWCRLSDLTVDPAYQRSTQAASSQTLIRRIAMFWDWSLCQPLAVARRLDVLKVVDGQHRLEAARLRGDIDQLPCVITQYASTGDEAAAFVALNQQRRPLNALDLFKAAIAAEDRETLLIVDALTSAGLSLASHSNYTAWKPGQVANVGSLRRVLLNKGEQVLRTALIALGKTYSNVVLRYGGTLFPGFAAVAMDEIRLRTPQDEIVAQLVPLIAVKSQDEWRHIIKAAVGESGGMAREASELVFRRVWRGRLNAGMPPPQRDLPESVRLLMVPAMRSPRERRASRALHLPVLQT